MKMKMNKMLKAAAKVATRMCNPDLYTFKAESLWDGQVIVNCYGNFVPFGDCSGYAYDLGITIEELLNANFPMPGKMWNMHSGCNFWSADGEEIHPSDEEHCDKGSCAQWVIFAEEE